MSTNHTDSVEVTEKTLIQFIIDAVWEATDGGLKMKPEQFYFQEELNGAVDRMLAILQATQSQQVEEAVRKAISLYDLEISPLLDTRLYPLLDKAKQRTLQQALTPNHQD